MECTSVVPVPGLGEIVRLFLPILLLGVGMFLISEGNSTWRRYGRRHFGATVAGFILLVLGIIFYVVFFIVWGAGSSGLLALTLFTVLLTSGLMCVLAYGYGIFFDH